MEKIRLVRLRSSVGPCAAIEISALFGTLSQNRSLRRVATQLSQGPAVQLRVLFSVLSIDSNSRTLVR